MYDYDWTLPDFATTHHFSERCRERGIPQDAHKVVARYGQRRLTKDGRITYHLSRAEAYRLSQCGVILWPYAGVTVVVSQDGVALTAYRVDDGRNT